MELFATCAFGLEKPVQNELKKLGLGILKTEDGRVTFEGDETAMIETNLWLRCAERVHIKMAEFHAVTFDQLFDTVNGLAWEKYIGPKDPFPNTASSVKSTLHSVPAIQSIVKKAMVKRLQQAHKTTLLPETSKAVYQVFIKANKDEFVVSINTSGDSLHKRGYRTQSNLAPIKETLAAALIQLSDWTPQRTLIDPFCGSGTIAIEASLIAYNMAPGLKREFAFHTWPWVDQKAVATAYQKARAAATNPQTTVANAQPANQAASSQTPQNKLPIYCFDIDPQTLLIAKHNAKRAGFPSMNFKRAAFQELDFSKFENCTFICNPPYGERLEDLPSVEQMYREFGEKFKQTKNCSLFLITSHENFPQLFGRRADKNRKLFNGTIRCYLFSYAA